MEKNLWILLLKVIRKISIKDGTFKHQVNIEEIAEDEVKRDCNGGMIMSLKEYYRRKDYIFI